MARWWKVGAVLLAGVWLAGPAQAQFFLFKKAAAQQEPPPAFSNGPEPKEPEFCPDPKSVPPGTPDFCPAPGGGPQTPFVPCNEEDRNAFCDWLHPEPAPLVLWVKGEYLNWSARDQHLPAILATTSTSPNLNTNFGTLGQSGTEVLFGPQAIDLGRLQGGRVTAGFCPGWLPPIEVSGFWLNRNNDLFSASSSGGPGAPVLARPIRAEQLNAESAFLAGFPGKLAGSIDIRSNFNLWGTDANMFFNLGTSDVAFVDFLIGYRFAELREGWQLVNTATPTAKKIAVPFDAMAGGIGPGNTTVAYDQFSTDNRFNGGQFGVRGGLNVSRFYLATDLKLALGSTNYNVTTFGTSSLITALTPFRGATTVPGGVLALASNSGTSTSNDFTIIPELDVNLGYQLCRSVRLFVGYSILYWSSVARPAEQISNIIDSRQAPTDRDFVPGFKGTVPTQAINRSDFWAQGFSVGVLFGW